MSLVCFIVSSSELVVVSQFSLVFNTSLLFGFVHCFAGDLSIVVAGLWLVLSRGFMQVVVDCCWIY